LFITAAPGEELDAAAEAELAPAAVLVVVGALVVEGADEEEPEDMPLVVIAPAPVVAVVLPDMELLIVVLLPDAAVEAHVAVCGRFVTPWPAHRAFANCSVAVTHLIIYLLFFHSWRDVLGRSYLLDPQHRRTSRHSMRARR
jgi:hypothetical protein